jgi:hypothetical protein
VFEFSIKKLPGPYFSRHSSRHRMLTTVYKLSVTANQFDSFLRRGLRFGAMLLNEFFLQWHYIWKPSKTHFLYSVFNAESEKNVWKLQNTKEKNIQLFRNTKVFPILRPSEYFELFSMKTCIWKAKKAMFLISMKFSIEWCIRKPKIKECSNFELASVASFSITGLTYERS